MQVYRLDAFEHLLELFPTAPEKPLIVLDKIIPHAIHCFTLSVLKAASKIPFPLFYEIGVHVIAIPVRREY
jgi:hypothetical protein